MRIPKAFLAALITLGLSSAVSIVGFARLESVSDERASRLHGAYPDSCNTAPDTTTMDYCTGSCSPIVNTNIGVNGHGAVVWNDCEEGSDSGDCEYPTYPEDGCTVPPQ